MNCRAKRGEEKRQVEGDMDCCICSPMASVFRPPRNTICSSCYEGAKTMLDFVGKSQFGGCDGQVNDSIKGISNAWNYMKERKEKEEKMEAKIEFLVGFGLAYHEKLHTDILVKPGNGPAIPAHRALLATRSVIFRTMLEWDECKAPASDSITLSELTHEEVHCLLEFLYTGSLPQEKIEKHSFSLLIAADKYEIPFLRNYCEREILRALAPSNALQVLEISEVCSNMTLKDRAMSLVLKHMEEIVFSPMYHSFALKNAHLGVEITRAFLEEVMNKECSATENSVPKPS